MQSHDLTRLLDEPSFERCFCPTENFSFCSACAMRFAATHGGCQRCVRRHYGTFLAVCGCLEPCACAVPTSVAMGGTVTGEHDMDIEKLNSMCVQFSADENALMFGVKHAFDPKGLRNPGKLIPTLQRCAEYGKLLVRGGQLPHPELPRF